MFDLREEQERVILVGVQENGGANAEESLDELAELASTAGANVEGRLVQVREAIHPGTYIGKGKLEILDTKEDKIQGLTKIMSHYSDKADWTFAEQMVNSVNVWKLTVTEWSCKEH